MAAVFLLAASSYSVPVRLVQWCVVALIFLFFLRVVRAVWVEVRPAGPRRERRGASPIAPPDEPLPAPRRGGRGKGPLFLEVVEPTERAGARIDVDGEMTVGRSPSCEVATTEDVYTSTVHARLFREGRHVFVEDLGSTNGTFVNSERIAKATKLGHGDIVQVGGTVFQVSR